MSFDISIDARVPVTNVFSAYHDISVTSQGGGYRIRLRDESVAPDRDFELAWTPIVHGGPATALFREHTDSGEHMLLMFMPPPEPARIAHAS